MKFLEKIAIIFFDILDKYFHQKNIITYLKKNIENIEVFFESKIRDEKKFNGIKELLNQITLDITIAKDKLNYGN